MLTKSDLSQIKNIVTEEVTAIVDQKLEPIKKDLKYLKKKVNRIDKTVSLTVKNYDESDVALGRRVRKIEQHLAISDGN